MLCVGTLPMQEYDLIADWYQRDRGPSVGVKEALTALAPIPSGSRVLDLGCGNGFPITDALVKAGYRVVGLDGSEGMLARFRRNLPDTPPVRGDARACPFADQAFDAAISWGMLFHLTPSDQSQAFASVSRVLKRGAPFLFTAAEIAEVGDDDPGITGTMNGVTFHYYAVPDYRRFIAPYGFELVDVVDDPGVSTYYFARRT
jgi:ubiquinone/menaquinone biosynthesis C-methylase UbiE